MVQCLHSLSKILNLLLVLEVSYEVLEEVSDPAPRRAALEVVANVLLHDDAILFELTLRHERSNNLHESTEDKTSDLLIVVSLKNGEKRVENLAQEGLDFLRLEEEEVSQDGLHVRVSDGVPVEKIGKILILSDTGR